jgi:UDP-N-acetylmuramoyl-L-alanyl-D-glutamate--2,6-diaminopimelate ligase
MEFIKKLIPTFLLKFLRPYYHGLLAIAASWYFGNPSSKLKVVGVTGTAGKSTTVQMLAHILNYQLQHPHPNPLPEGEGEKYRAGFITTVSFFDGEKEYINKHGLSMPGGWLLQKQLKQILNNGCKYAVVECTSEGLAQNRHLGINFDVAVLTNLSQAHIEAHGGFENYRKAKGKLFERIATETKLINTERINKAIVVNGDDENAEWFLQFSAEKKIMTGFNSPQPPLLKRGGEFVQAEKNICGF